ncbi:hypothetical protein AGABI2DRAFT_136705 [Agaricus bisporus var. bisporus H97]|uniref:hypothetical protein n=1 Tax=Agaricus bisporus var. bisporus (strain H97 / ATCC MYA-4626 / FGSC 10389) TaxID=936046 RepID=UPI00029F57A6|nr:hypothetical protein AGABI2DRAFT_136705 [Agaricus bisporus var. bisporus H97]EKV46468.1 hypothetical protein AGABI2DRAFT_136705 [Agaricus bisporus var. bisporus H97]
MLQNDGGRVVILSYLYTIDFLNKTFSGAFTTVTLVGIYLFSNLNHHSISTLFHKPWLKFSKKPF